MATQQHARPNDGTTESSSSDEAGGVNQNAASGTAKPAPSAAAAATSKKPNIFQRLWQKLDLDLITVMTMFKASLPPTIAVAFYQSHAVAGVYETLGYLVAVTSVLGMCIMPRGMFVQTMLLNVLAVCVGAAFCLLSLYCGIKARQNTTPAGSPPTGYNSSASAVLAVWLFFQTYMANVLRSALPQFQFPVIIYSIFLVVSLTYGTQFPTMSYATSFMTRLIEAFLTGFGIATGVSFLIFPLSSRKVIFKELSGYLNGLGGLLKLQTAYLASLEDWEPDTDALTQDPEKTNGHKKSNGQAGPQQLFVTAPGKKLKETLQKIYELHTKIPTDLNFAKREIAFGKLSPKDLGEIWKRMRFILPPIFGLSAVLDILQRRAEESGWENGGPGDLHQQKQRKHIDDLHQLMKSLHEPVAFMSASLNSAFQHVLLTLELVEPPKKKKHNDEENAGLEPVPGTPAFAEGFRKQLDRFDGYKKQTLEEWCHQHGINIPPGFFDSTFIRPEHLDTRIEQAREENQRQLFFGLYIHHLLWKTGQAALDLVLYADQRKQDGALNKNRLIVPGVNTFKKWLRAAFGRQDYHDEDLLTADLSSSQALDLGESFGKSKDPEHLPPRNRWERIGEGIRWIPQALRSDHSAFGFRVACATLSLGIVCYLEASQRFFLRHRLLWALIMIPISMTRTAGQSTWSFALRILGTFVAMVATYIIWYIVDGKTAGVIFFLWLWIFLAFYILLKQKTLLVAGIISIVTAILVIGYELQTRVVGIAVSESNGQPAYQTYLLAPYRLATVCAGLATAYFWTIFPYPVSESTELRKDVGAALYMLANLSSIVHELVRARVQKTDGDENIKNTRGFHLEKARNIVFTKTLTLLTNLHQNSAFNKFQIRVGGRFPHQEYTSLIESIQRVLQYTSLIAYASRTFSSSSSSSENDSAWSTDFRKLLTEVNATSHHMTSLLSLLSSSLTGGRALPPYLDLPQQYHGMEFVQRLQAIDGDILSVRHIAEPEYAAFAVIQICAQCIRDDVMKITRHVRNLVGVIDFSFHVQDREREDALDDSSMDDNTAEKK